MDEIQYLENRFGSRWCGVKFDCMENGQGRSGQCPLSFCQAIAQSQDWPIALTQELMDCPGARFSLGWYEEEKNFPEVFAKKSGLQIEKAKGIIDQNATLHGELRKVIIGTHNEPDVLISFAQPKMAMQIIQKWQSLSGCNLLIETSGFMSICSAVGVRAFQTDQICISFGCPLSRLYTGLGRDRLIIGLSRKLAKHFQEASDEYQ